MALEVPALRSDRSVALTFWVLAFVIDMPPSRTGR
jgi:hypothetical protein